LQSIPTGIASKRIGVTRVAWRDLIYWRYFRTPGADLRMRDGLARAL
jgi:hypothetical protein